MNFWKGFVCDFYVVLYEYQRSLRKKTLGKTLLRSFGVKFKSKCFVTEKMFFGELFSICGNVLLMNFPQKIQVNVYWRTFPSLRNFP
jgi:hypothetical protein